jgi:hypothetical protein
MHAKAWAFTALAACPDSVWLRLRQKLLLLVPDNRPAILAWTCFGLNQQRGAPPIRLCGSPHRPSLDEIGRLIGDKPINAADADVSLHEVVQNGMTVLLDASSDKLHVVHVKRSKTKNDGRTLSKPSTRIAWLHSAELRPPMKRVSGDGAVA